MAGQSYPTADLSRANAARVHDWLLGGTLNTPIDRVVGAHVEKLWPSVRQVVRASRAFLRLAVSHMIESGIRQFVELGAGLPANGHVHQLARDQQTGVAVVYVDNDPVVAALGEAALWGRPETTYVRADVLSAQSVLDHEATRQVIDFDEPVGLLMVEILHLVPAPTDMGQLIDSYRRRLCSGSGLALSHVTPDATPWIEKLNASCGDMLGRVTPRQHSEVSALLTGLSLVEPGLAPFSAWLPSDEDKAEADSLSRCNLAAIGYQF